MRYYDVNGKLYPSVTTVLNIIHKPFLDRWRGELGNEAADNIMEEAGGLGSEVHDIAEAIACGREWTTDNPHIRLMAEAYQNWFVANVRKVIYIEHAVVDTIYGYAGRLDLCAVLRGDRLPSLFDIKTGGVYPDAFIQLAAYKKPLRISVGRRHVIHIDKKNPGKISVKDPEHEFDTDYRMFLYCLELFRYFNRGAPKESQIVKLKGGNENVSISA